MSTQAATSAFAGVVTSLNLLHEATPLTRGERFVVVPFLFDEAGEAVRRANLGLVDFPAGASAPKA